jgi:hypothetical protein
MHLVGYLYEAYHDARSLKHKVPSEPQNKETIKSCVTSNT